MTRRTMINLADESVVGSANPLPVTGSFAIPVGAATEVTLAALLTETEGKADLDETQPVSIAIPSSIYHGQKTIASAGTEEAIGSSQAISSGVTVKALAGNTGIVYVGANPVTSSTGFELSAGEQVFLEVANIATVFIDVATNDDGVSYVAT